MSRTDRHMHGPGGTMWHLPLLVLLLLLTALACGIGGGEPTEPAAPAGSQGSGWQPELTVPDGWTSEAPEPGQLVVTTAAGNLDLDEEPTGPRLIIQPGLASTENLGALVEKALSDLSAVESTEVKDEPSMITIDGREAVAITLSQGTMIRRIVTVNLGQGRAYQITAEAPAEMWSSSAAELEVLLSGVTFSELE